MILLLERVFVKRIRIIDPQEYDLYGNFDKFWRVRLDMMRVVLLDEFEKPIPSPGSGFGGYIRVGITYPTTFNDTNFQNDKFSFLAQDFFCMAEYSTSGEGISFFDRSPSLVYKKSNNGN